MDHETDNMGAESASDDNDVMGPESASDEDSDGFGEVTLWDTGLASHVMMPDQDVKLA